MVETVDGVYRDFGRARTDADGEALKLWRLEDRNGNWIEVEREAHDEVVRPVRLHDSAGRLLTLSYDKLHPQRIGAIELTRGVDGEQPDTLVRYAYGNAGELVAVTDRSGHIGRRFAYEHGLMVQHTLPGGLRVLCVAGCRPRRACGAPLDQRRRSIRSTRISRSDR